MRTDTSAPKGWPRTRNWRTPEDERGRPRHNAYFYDQATSILWKRREDVGQPATYAYIHTIALDACWPDRSEALRAAIGALGGKA